jgi:hypothetical protein
MHKLDQLGVAQVSGFQVQLRANTEMHLLVEMVLRLRTDQFPVNADYQRLAVGQLDVGVRLSGPSKVDHFSAGLCQLVETEAKRRQEKRPSERVGRILGDFGEFTPGNESRRELFAIE